MRRTREEIEMTYADEMSKKIMSATPAELEEISNEIEMEIYEALTTEAKAKLAKFV